MQKSNNFWSDAGNNRWSTDRYTEEQARSMSTALTDCHNCLNCTYCENCNGCTDCTGCFSCVSCYGCVNCIGCNSCKGCNDCRHCTDCDRCELCAYCMDAVLCCRCRGVVNRTNAYAVCSDDPEFRPGKVDVDAELKKALDRQAEENKV